MIRNILVAVTALIMGSAYAWADVPTPKADHGVFLSASGDVSLISRDGKRSKPAVVGMNVAEGQTVKTGDNSTAVVELFDGSQITVSPDTQFKLSALKKVSDTDKTIHFNLLVGKLLAQVSKLLSSKSSFEIEAGGVVCGVRGTQFTMDYDPNQTKLILDVIEGVVYANSNGQITDYNAGSLIEFVNGFLTNPPNQNGNPTGGPTGFNSSNYKALFDLSGQFVETIGGAGGTDSNNPIFGGTNSNPIVSGFNNTITDPAVTGVPNVEIVVVPGSSY